MPTFAEIQKLLKTSNPAFYRITVTSGTPAFEASKKAFPSGGLRGIATLSGTMVTLKPIDRAKAPKPAMLAALTKQAMAEKTPLRFMLSDPEADAWQDAEVPHGGPRGKDDPPPARPASTRDADDIQAIVHRAQMLLADLDQPKLTAAAGQLMAQLRKTKDGDDLTALSKQADALALAVNKVRALPFDTEPPRRKAQMAVFTDLLKRATAARHGNALALLKGKGRSFIDIKTYDAARTDKLLKAVALMLDQPFDGTKAAAGDDDRYGGTDDMTKADPYDKVDPDLMP